MVANEPCDLERWVAGEERDTVVLALGNRRAAANEKLIQLLNKLTDEEAEKADGLVSELMETSYRAGEVHGMEIADTMEHAQYLLKREK
jgi:hypothetical protein